MVLCDRIFKRCYCQKVEYDWQESIKTLEDRQQKVIERGRARIGVWRRASSGVHEQRWRFGGS